jgi:hypothetical protein
MGIVFDADKIQTWHLSERKPRAFPVFQTERHI